MKMGGLSEFNDAAVDAARLLKRLELALELRLKTFFARARRASRKIESPETSSTDHSLSLAPEESPMSSPMRNCQLELRLKTFFARARRASRKIESRETSSTDHSLSLAPEESPMASPMRNSKFALPSPTTRFSPKSPLHRLKLSSDSPLLVSPKRLLASPKRLLATLSNKAAPLLQRWKVEEEEKGGLWQKEILMGEKCQPLDFSGVIYYDKHGKRVAGIPPRSPRRGGQPLVQSFSFPVPLSEKEDF